MNKVKTQPFFEPIVYAGIATWALVFAVTLSIILDDKVSHITHVLPIVLVFIVYIVCFMIVASHRHLLFDRRYFRTVIYLIQLLCAFLLLWMLPVSFLSILTIIWVAALPYFTTFKRSLAIGCLVVVVWFVLASIKFEQPMFIEGMLYGSFHLFAILAHTQARKEKDARELLEAKHRELIATQHLLSEATKVNERTRIARDLHDLVGHHLTAMTINLQVASRLSKDEPKEKIDQCHSIAKLLLTDVREAVSTLRENQHLDLKTSIEFLTQNIPSMSFHLDIAPSMSIDEIAVGEALLRCVQEAITNSVKHSKATDIFIHLNASSDEIQLIFYDNGNIDSRWKAGNGLKGMKERIEAVFGDIKFVTSDGCLAIHVTIPTKQRLVSTENYSQ